MPPTTRSCCLPLLLVSLFSILAGRELPAQGASPWQMENSGTTAGLRGVHAVGGGVVWASGTNGTVLRTEDSGYMWQSCAMPPGAEKLDFRAIWAWDANTAVVMSSGTGDQSRLYKTIDGCSHWKAVNRNVQKNGFWDALVFINPDMGLLLGDPASSNAQQDALQEQEVSMQYTNDGGEIWSGAGDGGNRAPGRDMHPLPGESFFAASNSVMVASNHWLWLATSQARVLRLPLPESSFRPAGCAGQCGSPSQPIRLNGWQSAQAPLAHGTPSSGIFSLDFRDATRGIVTGGDYAKPNQRTGTSAWTSDGGQHWTASTILPGGYRSAVAWDPDRKLWITVGPNGSDLSRDDGRTWQPIEQAPASTPKGGEWNALSLPWVVGPNGRIAKLNAEALPKARAERR